MRDIEEGAGCGGVSGRVREAERERERTHRLVGQERGTALRDVMTRWDRKMKKKRLFFTSAKSAKFQFCVCVFVVFFSTTVCALPPFVQPA